MQVFLLTAQRLWRMTRLGRGPPNPRIVAGTKIDACSRCPGFGYACVCLTSHTSHPGASLLGWVRSRVSLFWPVIVLVIVSVSAYMSVGGWCLDEWILCL